jgi:hypothetical protein
MEPTIKKFVKITAAGVGALIVIGILSTMFRTVELGMTDVYQNTLTGNKVVYHGPDFYLSPLFVGKERTYKDETTIVFSRSEDDNGQPVAIGFADTYQATLPLSVRYRLPTDDEHMFALDKSFRSYNNLVNSLYAKTTVDVSVGTATQFTAEEVFQGGLNGLKSAIEDQIKNGLFVTERKRVVVANETTSRVDVGEDKTKASQVEQQITVWKAVPKLDRDGMPLRMVNPFDQYGVFASQLTLELPHPEQRLEILLVAKKESVAKKILSVQKQDNAKEDIKTAKLEGQAAREKAEQERLITADAEIIEMKKQVSVAQQQALKEIVEQQKIADLAIIDKKKELQVSQANEGIQKANEVAAKFEAQSKLHNGLADAKILKAKYDAYDKTLYAMEIQRDTMMAVTTNLQGINITMPTVSVQGGSNGTAMNSLDTVMQAIGIQKLEEIAKASKVK